MKLPIVSRKRFELMKDNFKKSMEARHELQKNYVAEQIAHTKLHEKIRVLANENEYLATQIDDLKKENKRLKSLCTRNHIVYKKEAK